MYVPTSTTPSVAGAHDSRFPLIVCCQYLNVMIIKDTQRLGI